MPTRSNPRTLGLVLAMVAGLAAADTAAAQATFHACYVPDIGALYLIQAEGLPESCLAESHVPVSWTDGMTELPDGAVGTAKLAEGAVTGAKIGGSAVGTSHIEDGAVTTEKVEDGSIGHGDLATGTIAARAVAHIDLNDGDNITVMRAVNFSTVVEQPGCGPSWCAFELTLAPSVGSIANAYVVGTASSQGVVVNTTILHPDPRIVVQTTPATATQLTIVVF